MKAYDEDAKYILFINKSITILGCSTVNSFTIDFLGHISQQYLGENGILSQYTPPGTPQHNGVSEKRNRTLLDMVRSMMGLASLPISFWRYALESACYLLNRVPSKSVIKTPYEIWTGRKPVLSHLRIWRCPAYVTDKLGPRSDKCSFIGYPK